MGYLIFKFYLRTTPNVAREFAMGNLCQETVISKLLKQRPTISSYKTTENKNNLLFHKKSSEKYFRITKI